MWWALVSLRSAIMATGLLSATWALITKAIPWDWWIESRRSTRLRADGGARRAHPAARALAAALQAEVPQVEVQRAEAQLVRTHLPPAGERGAEQQGAHPPSAEGHGARP